MENHIKFMKRCLELAELAKKHHFTAVGSLLVKDEKIVAEGAEGMADWPQAMAHAENIALIKATALENTKDLSSYTLYTTVEPCYMCSYLIRQLKVGQVVMGMKTYSTGGVSSPYPILTAHDISKWGKAPLLVEGILEEECKRLLES